MTDIVPSEIRYQKQSKRLLIQFEGLPQAELSAEYLRVYSPSAEVKGHGPGQEVLQTGKENVAITKIEPVGNYAVRLVFDDGHDTGLYTWAYFYELAVNQNKYWRDYLQRLEEQGFQRIES